MPTPANQASTTASAGSVRAAATASGAGRSAGLSTSVSSVRRVTVDAPSNTMSTATGPTPSSKTTVVVPPGTSMRPRRARTAAVPMVGCPAKGISAAGVKIRTRRVWRGSSGGSTKVVSAKLNSRARACIARSDRPRASGKTASWLPPKAVPVKTSAMAKRCDIGYSSPPPVLPRHEVDLDRRAQR